MFQALSSQSSRPVRPAIAAAALLATALSFGARAEDPVKLDVPYVPTPPQVVARMLQLAEVGPQDYVIDLGSGDGRIAIAAARDFGARAEGVDIDPVRVSEANANAKEAGVADRVSFDRKNLFDMDFSKATVLTMYLFPEVNLQLRPRILKELPPGTRVVSHAFTMDTWAADRHEQVDGRNVFLWIVPAQVDGRWAVSSPQGDFTLTLKQEFQQVEGQTNTGAGSNVISDATLAGDRLQFTTDGPAGRQVYVGKVEGNTIRATPADNSVQGWTATRL